MRAARWTRIAWSAALAAGLLTATLSLAAPQGPIDFSDLERRFPEPWRMSYESHTLLPAPPPALSYIPERDVRRGLPARDIPLVGPIADDFFEYDKALLDDPSPWSQSHWSQTTHIGLSDAGDIRLADVDSGGRVLFEGEDTPRDFEIYVVRRGDPLYRRALSRVMALAPGLKRGAGMIRLMPVVQAPWPFFDYDFVTVPLYAEPQLNVPLKDLAIVTVEGEPDPAALLGWTTSPSTVLAGWRVNYVSWEADGDLLLVGYSGHAAGASAITSRPILLRVPPTHPRYAGVLVEVRRIVPGLRQAAGFTSVDLAPPPWPFETYEVTVDRARARDFNYYQPFAPPSPPVG